MTKVLIERKTQARAQMITNARQDSEDNHEREDDENKDNKVTRAVQNGVWAL